MPASVNALQKPSMMREAIARLLDGMTWTDAADEIGVARSTLYDWRQAPEFQSMLAEMTAERSGLSTAIAAGLTPKAIRHLGRRIDDADKPALADAAARDILDRGGVPRGTQLDATASSPPTALDLSQLADEELDALITDAALKEAERRGRILDR